MEIEWVFDVDKGGSIEVDPEDVVGLTAEQVEDYILAKCRRNAKENVHCFVPWLSEAVAELMESQDDD